MPELLLSNIIVPVGNKEDALTTIEALLPYINGNSEEITFVNVIEKGGGTIDKASVKQREIESKNIFSIVKEKLKDADVSIKTEILYGEDIAKTIIDKSDEVNATSIVFTPRGGGRWIKLLTGDVTINLIKKSNIPIIVLQDKK